MAGGSFLSCLLCMSQVSYTYISHMAFPFILQFTAASGDAPATAGSGDAPGIQNGRNSSILKFMYIYMATLLEFILKFMYTYTATHQVFRMAEIHMYYAMLQRIKVV